MTIFHEFSSIISLLFVCLDDSEEERALEELLFGKISSKLNVLQKNHEKSKDGEVPDVSMNDNESGNLVKGDEEVDYEDINVRRTSPCL